MSEIKGKVGPYELVLKSLPRGKQGKLQVIACPDRSIDVTWRRDEHGLWLDFPHGVFGFDVLAHEDESGRLVYQLSRRGFDERWGSLSFVRTGEETIPAAGQGKKKGVRVRAQMPGKIIRLLVKNGSVVSKGETLAVMEAMKMENEIRSPQSGKVGQVNVSEGEAVESGADLFTIDST